MKVVVFKMERAEKVFHEKVHVQKKQKITKKLTSKKVTNQVFYDVVVGFVSKINSVESVAVLEKPRYQKMVVVNEV